MANNTMTSHPITQQKKTYIPSILYLCVFFKHYFVTICSIIRSAMSRTWYSFPSVYWKLTMTGIPLKCYTNVVTVVANKI